MTAFLKMHGLGNDFAVFDARKQALALGAEAARAIADRRRGIGCDQLIVIERAANGADAFMRVLNADGSEAQSCGNAARCVARLLMTEKRAGEVRLDTKGGLVVCNDAGGGLVTVDMGAPKFGWRDIPLARETDDEITLELPGTAVTGMAVSVGNPHFVVSVPDAEAVALTSIGPKIENHPLFPERTNVEFISPLGPDRIRMRVFERGAGVTEACGSGACAAAVVAFRKGATGRKLEVVLDGGTLAIELRESDEHMLMTGPASLSFRGDIDLKEPVA